MESDTISEVCDDQQLLKNFSIKLNERRKSSVNCDYTLKTEDGESFAVHKLVLELVSPFFEIMFNSDFDDKEKDSFVVKYCSSVVLEKIIEFMYTSKVEITFDIAKETLDTALFLGFNTLVDTCTRVMVKAANYENCIDLFEYSETYFSGEALTKKCVEIIGKNIEALIDTSEFVEMSLDLIKMLCSCDRNLCNDEQLYLAIVKWIKFDMENREQYISVLFDQLKFEEISLEFGIKEILRDNLLWKNHDTSKITRIMSENWTQQLEKKQNKKLFKRCDAKNLYTIVGDDMLLYDCKTELFSTVITQLENKREVFGYATFEGNNVFICGGLKNGTITSGSSLYSLQENCWKSLPSMDIARWCHRAITINKKIYACGGVQENTVEIFDVSKAVWMKGPSFDREIENIGLCLYNNIIYGVDGSNIQFLDTRADEWVALPSLYENPDFMYSAVSYNDNVYGFGLEGISTFDIRANKWLENFVHYEKNFSNNLPETCIIGDEVFVFAKINKDEKFVLNSYRASNLCQNYGHFVKFDGKDEDCFALFSL